MSAVPADISKFYLFQCPWITFPSSRQPLGEPCRRTRPLRGCWGNPLLLNFQPNQWNTFFFLLFSPVSQMDLFWSLVSYFQQNAWMSKWIIPYPSQLHPSVCFSIAVVWMVVMIVGCSASWLSCRFVRLIEGMELTDYRWAGARSLLHALADRIPCNKTISMTSVQTSIRSFILGFLCVSLSLSLSLSLYLLLSTYFSLCASLPPCLSRSCWPDCCRAHRKEA